MTAAFLFPVLAVILVAANGISFLLFLSDKRRAKRGARRIPEGTLLCSAAIGPFGAFAAMRLFHHKTRKGKFLLVPLFLALHVLAILWLSLFIGTY